MTKQTKLLILLLLLQQTTLQHSQVSKINSSIVTYNMCRCRFGSRIIAYVKTKWLAYKYNIPFFYQPFEYSDQLMLTKLEKKYDKDIEQYFNQVIYLEENPVNIDREAKNVYVGDYYTDTTIDFTDKQFMKEIKKNITPIKPINKPSIPADRISVAVHIRRGGGFDAPVSFDKETHPKNYVDFDYPGKFLTDEYYITQINSLYTMLQENPLHVHIFTDDKHPSRFIETYKKALQTKDITFSTRKSGSFTTNVIDDFFSMALYDCFIMPDSGFSWCVKQLLGTFFVVISHTDNKVRVEINQDNFHRVEKHLGTIKNIHIETFNKNFGKIS